MAGSTDNLAGNMGKESAEAYAGTFHSHIFKIIIDRTINNPGVCIDLVRLMERCLFK
jgi:hypothetical protein